MSDKPLFQNADEQEARYAPEQLAPKETSAGVDIAPTVAGAYLPENAGPTSAGVSNPIAPVVGAAALAEETEQQDAGAGDRSAD